MGSTLAERVPAPSHVDDIDIVHTCCCLNQDVALCGEDLTDAVWVEEPEVCCVDCELVIVKDIECPYGHTCPIEE